MEREPWTQSASGKRIFMLNPEKTEVSLVDIAHHLAQTNRYGGACRMPYNVAQHSVLVSYVDPNIQVIHKLLHDAAEAYMWDLLGPYKKFSEFDFFAPLEARWMHHIYTSLGIPPVLDYRDVFPTEWWMTAPVRHADEVMLCVEAEALMPPDHFWTARKEKLLSDGHIFKKLSGDPWVFHTSRYNFVHRFCELTGRDWPKDY